MYLLILYSLIQLLDINIQLILLLRKTLQQIAYTYVCQITMEKPITGKPHNSITGTNVTMAAYKEWHYSTAPL